MCTSLRMKDKRKTLVECPRNFFGTKRKLSSERSVSVESRSRSYPIKIRSLNLLFLRDAADRRGSSLNLTRFPARSARMRSKKLIRAPSNPFSRDSLSHEIRKRARTSARIDNAVAGTRRLMGVDQTRAR